MQNIKKLALISILSLIFFNNALADNNPVNIKQQVDQQKIQDSNILVEEYFNIGNANLG